MNFTGLTTKPPPRVTGNALEVHGGDEKQSAFLISGVSAHALPLPHSSPQKTELLTNFPSWHLYIFKDKKTWVSYSMERQNTATHLPVLCVHGCVRGRGQLRAAAAAAAAATTPTPHNHYFLEYFRSLEYDLDLERDLVLLCCEIRLRLEPERSPDLDLVRRDLRDRGERDLELELLLWRRRDLDHDLEDDLEDLDLDLEEPEELERDLE